MSDIIDAHARKHVRSKYSEIVTEDHLMMGVAVECYRDGARRAVSQQELEDIAEPFIQKSWNETVKYIARALGHVLEERR